MDFKELCENIDNYEAKCLAEEWDIHYYNDWKGVKFSEIIENRRRGLGAGNPIVEAEISQRIGSYVDLGHKYDKGVGMHNASDMEYLQVWQATIKTVDTEIGTNLFKIVFDDKTPEEIIDEWEEEERRETIDEVAKWAYNDGICDSLDEAYMLAEMTY